MAQSDHMFKMAAYGITDVGLERKNNEDAFQSEASAGLYVVCDGMGGHASGELASRITVDSIVEFVTETIHNDNFRWPFQSPAATTVETKVLDCAIRIANRKVFQEAQADARHKGMGTTVVAMLAGRDQIGAVHVGDSRIYRWRSGELEQLTDDHSLLNHYKRTRPMSDEEIRTFRGKNVIVRAVGLRDTVEPETHVWDYRTGDVYLLCTDGLSDLVDDEYIGSQMARAADSLKSATTNLVQKALAAGGKDNVTVMLVHVEGADGLDAATEEFEAIKPDPQVGLEDTSPGFGAVGEGDYWDHETMPGLPNSGIEALRDRENAAAPNLIDAPTGTNNRILRVTPDTVQIKIRRSADGSLQALNDDTPDEAPAIAAPHRRQKSDQFSRTLVDSGPASMPQGREPPSAEIRIRRSSPHMANTEPYGAAVIDPLSVPNTEPYRSVNVESEDTPQAVPVVPPTKKIERDDD